MARATEVTTIHLLRGLVREGEGIACGILESIGIGLDQVRAETRRIELEQEQKEAEAREAEKPTPEEETVQKLQAVLENPKTPDRTKSFIMDLVNRVTSFAEGEIDH